MRAGFCNIRRVFWFGITAVLMLPRTLHEGGCLTFEDPILPGHQMREGDKYYEHAQCLRRYPCSLTLSQWTAPIKETRGPGHTNTLTLGFCFDITAAPMQRSRRVRARRQNPGADGIRFRRAFEPLKGRAGRRPTWTTPGISWPRRMGRTSGYERSPRSVELPKNVRTEQKSPCVGYIKF